MNEQTPLSSVMTDDEIKTFRAFVQKLGSQKSNHLMRNDILLRFEEHCSNNGQSARTDGNKKLFDFISKAQEILISEGDAILLHRPKLGQYKFYKIHNGQGLIEELNPNLFLDCREAYSDISYTPPEKKLLIDFAPFHSRGPALSDHKKIGSGQRFLNSFIAGKLQMEPEKWGNHLYEFLKIHSINNKQILVDGHIIKNRDQLYEALQAAIWYLANLSPELPMKSTDEVWKSLGFREGFGSTVRRARETMQLLVDLLEEPKPALLDEFFSRIPLTSKIAVISPHGWFGQENVLGRPDTGGQVVYILDQVSALEKHLAATLKSSGIEVAPKVIVLTRLIPENDGTTSNQRLEKIQHTKNSWILRVPFRDEEGDVIPHWISRFQIWPYLEQFALDSKEELLGEFGGKPDLVIGNYSDGNLVGSLLSSWFNVTQCNIAHALEKSKYPFSDLRWKKEEKDYHFSLQHTADLIAMNKADIIVSSTFQEIAGTDTTLGQYESFSQFSLPDLYQVINGINLLHPKFNVVPPGVDENIYFPFTKQEKRLKNRIEDLNHLLFHKTGKSIHGYLENPEKKPIFTMARLDKVKNITGLVESYGQNKKLQDIANLIIVAGTVNLEETTTKEEADELKCLYRLIDQYQLKGKIRWLSKQTHRPDNGELYRIIADRQGVFVQPALFEAFGLTVLEAMVSGLPVFATQFGGPLEIIQNRKNGFLIDPTQLELLTKPILEFFVQTSKQPDLWKNISNQAVSRIRECYTWKRYSGNLLKSAKLYWFWNHSARKDEKKEIDQYCDLLFQRIYKRRVDEMKSDGLKEMAEFSGE